MLCFWFSLTREPGPRPKSTKVQLEESSICTDTVFRLGAILNVDSSSSSLSPSSFSAQRILQICQVLKATRRGALESGRIRIPTLHAFGLHLIPSTLSNHGLVPLVGYKFGICTLVCVFFPLERSFAGKDIVFMWCCVTILLMVCGWIDEKGAEGMNIGRTWIVSDWD